MSTAVVESGMMGVEPRTRSAEATPSAKALDADLVALPAGLARTETLVYRGVWVTEETHVVPLENRRDMVAREIWVRLASGRDKVWKANDPHFAALPGHRVGVLVWVGEGGRESIVGMVNYDTGQERLFWSPPQRGLGLAAWIAVFFGAFALDGPAWKLYTWLVCLAALSGLTIWDFLWKQREEALDRRRLGFIASTG